MKVQLFADGNGTNIILVSENAFERSVLESLKREISNPTKPQYEIGFTDNGIEEVSPGKYRMNRWNSGCNLIIKPNRK